MSKIRIISAPVGQAPEWVREQWVGLELPVKDITVPDGEQRGVLGGAASPENFGGYPVDTRRAIEILSAKSPEAAEWWRTNLSPRSSALVFGKQFCELVA